jgi:hypothetical protein
MQIDAMLVYYFKVNPDELTDEEYAMKFSQMKWVLKEESKRWGK